MYFSGINLDTGKLRIFIELRKICDAITLPCSSTTSEAVMVLQFLNGHRRASVLVVLPFSCPRFSFLTICCFYLFTAILVGKGIFIHLFFVKLQILHEIMKCCYQIATKAKRMKREKQHMYKSLNGEEQRWMLTIVIG